MQALEELNLSSNLLSSNSNVINPNLIFKALGTIKRLKVLNLSRNRFLKFHSELLNTNLDFV